MRLVNVTTIWYVHLFRQVFNHGLQFLNLDVLAFVNTLLLQDCGLLHLEYNLLEFVK